VPAIILEIKIKACMSLKASPQGATVQSRKFVGEEGSAKRKQKIKKDERKLPKIKKQWEINQKS